MKVTKPFSPRPDETRGPDRGPGEAGSIRSETSPPFSRRAVAVLIAAATTLFALSILLSAFDGRSQTRPASNRIGAGTFSTSAIGHAGIYDVLKRLGRPVQRSMGEKSGFNRSGGALVVIEPDLGRVGEVDDSSLASAKRLLLVLPKWRGVKSETSPDWVSRVYPVGRARANRTLALVDKESRVAWAAWPSSWKVNEVGYAPAGSSWIQLIRSDKMRPLVQCDEGILVGEILSEGRKILVLSDPDLVSNRGLVKGDNAAFMVSLIDGLRNWDNAGNRAPVVFDEALHGFLKSRRSLLNLLFSFPFAIVTILVCASAALLAWSGAGRFGAPLVARPPIDFGKTTLIGNGARLLDYAGYHSDVLKRYVRMAIRSAAAALHAPPSLDDYGQAEWLDRIGQSRGVRGSCKTILKTIDSLNTDDENHLDQLYQNVWAIHHWKGELLNEHSARRRHS